MNKFTISLIAITLATIIATIIQRNKKQKIKLEHINEKSYQSYAKFYDNIVPKDEEFNNKINIIYNLINNGEKNIKTIATKSKCSIEECILKIRYLKNKRFLDNYYIDNVNNQLLVCDSKDQELLDKYKPYIYGSHLQVNEIANIIPNKGYKNIKELREEVYNEIVYLNKKGLINGIKIDDIDRKIIYYTIEKRKVNSSYESINCPNCGALNDVEIDGKVRCGYCNTILKGTKYEENI